VPTLIIIAGPNGAGKTTFAREYLFADDRQFEFINADEIAIGLTGRDLPAPSDFDAARTMLRRVDELIEASADFVVGTTLANLTYAQKIPLWRLRGYRVSLVYVRLDSIEDSIARVRERVAARGHDIPETTIRRRFGRSKNYFETIYRPIVDEWYIWESRQGAFALTNSWDGRHETRT
jgi:predicted ABC-type ATPase